FGENSLSETAVTSVDEGPELFESLISDRTLLASEYRSRNSPYRFKSIHPADEQREIDDGWELVRPGKRRTRVRRMKSADQQLEDRVWCFLYRIGYQQLNGRRFNIKFERNDGSIGRKQIDVFVCDSETAL